MTSTEQHTTETVTTPVVKGIPLLPKVKTKHYTIVLPSPLATRLAKPVTGQGGWQDLLTDLKAHTDGESLELPEKLMHRMIPYAVKFGSGGYQGIIRWILCLLLEQHNATILGVPETLKGSNGSGSGKGGQ